jgi:hypothetical protein
MRDVIKGKEVAAAEPLEEPGKEPTRRSEPAFHLNRRVFKAYLLKESLEKLWDYRYEGAMLNYLEKWIDQLRWQRLPSFQKLADMLLKHLERDSELLPDQGPLRSRGSDQRQHPYVDQPRPRL